MFKIEITENQANQRLDRFLKKYFNNASLGTIYKLIRKDVKVNGKRANESTLLANGDELTLYISDETAAGLRKEKRRVKVKKQFKIAYEDDDLLIVEKPFGLLTHGDRTEKKNHLANQVIDYLIEKGDYNPRTETTFVPAPANRPSLPLPPEFATSSHNNIKLFLYFSRFSLIFLCSYDTIYM